MLNIQGTTCIHAFVTPEQCGRPIATRKTHGYLCNGHYRQQQDSIPPRPRKPQPRWKGLMPTSEEAIIRDIIATDAHAIQAGRVERVQYGKLEPVYMKLLHPPAVH